jgi:hypothetical protein
VDGVKTGDAGEVVWTAYTTNDSTAPSASALLTLAGRDFLSFQKLTMVQGTGYMIDADTNTSTNIKLQDCTLLGNVAGGNNLVDILVAFSVVANWTVERCFIRSDKGNAFNIGLATGTGSNYDTNIVIRNCIFEMQAATSAVLVTGSGAGAQEGGGVYIYNCTVLSGSATSTAVIRTVGTTVGGSAFAFPVRVYNSVLRGGVNAGESGAIVENYNHISANTTHTNVTQGAQTVTNSARAVLLDSGQGRYVGTNPRPYGEPMAGSPYLGFGNDGTYTSAEDLRGNVRPAGGASATKGIGALERGNTFAKETGTVRTGSNAISITGPGYQDFQLPVAAQSNTVTVYVRWDATYAGTKPKMQVLNGTEAGVADATATATGSSGAWEQLSLNFTPTSAGIVTIRLLSSDTNGGGKMFADDFAVS